MKKQFEVCNKMANINLNNKGNLSKFLVPYLSLAESLGKSELAYEEVSKLPPAQSFNNPDLSVDVIISACTEELQSIKENAVIGMVK